jgi:hypothetical protein
MVGRRGTALVDGTVCPVWDWDAIPDLYSGKAKVSIRRVIHGTSELTESAIHGAPA